MYIYNEWIYTIQYTVNFNVRKRAQREKKQNAVLQIHFIHTAGDWIHVG